VTTLQQHKKRFSFWKVFGVIVALNGALAIISLLSILLAPEMFRHDMYSQAWFWQNQGLMVIYYSLYYYFSLNHYYKLIIERRKFYDYLIVSLVASVPCIAYMALDDYLFPSPITEKAVNTKPGTIAFTYFISLLFYIGFSLLIAYLVSLRDERIQRKVLEEQKRQLETEKTHANLNFLKAQINPHFLHNTLNFLYAKSLPYSSELSEGILTLSDIMRYALSDNTKNGKAALKDEIEHVRNVIRIHQLRYDNNLHVNFEVNGVVNGATIIPFVLITIVENAFKHGDLKSTEHPIDMKLYVDGSRLQFYCRNKKKNGPKELSTGIGLDNIKKRLDLAYNNQYALDIKDEHELYTTQLTIHSL
jgi:two-component system, LytTR family, sensor kinase